MGVRDHRYKLIHFFDYDAWEFYDLEEDPEELDNLYDNARYEAAISQLKKRFKALKIQFAVPEPPALKPKPARRPKRPTKK